MTCDSQRRRGEQLLLTAEQLGPKTVGFWEFEPQAGVFEEYVG